MEPEAYKDAWTEGDAEKAAQDASEPVLSEWHTAYELANPEGPPWCEPGHHEWYVLRECRRCKATLSPEREAE
jgi:hypothetical protein